jgi:UDP-N-acetyl-D-glucosamine/UDP-N-acetyl-D-galactosamine dehydrogenase
MIDKKNIKIAIIGLGYVGLPLAVEFGKFFNTIGFDINSSRVDQLMAGYDSTFEVKEKQLKVVSKLKYTTNSKDLKSCNIFIITVPTPIDNHNNPDLNPLINASNMVGALLNNDDIVIYESTVYPGATEEVCVPILEKISKLEFNKNFFCGYSPERINPGDQNHRLPTIKKITSGSTPQIADIVDQLYQVIITAGTHKTSSIKVAEAAKVIENTQRDVNIALINELALIFNKIGIDTESVLEAAETKWNFLPFRPGLVGGHCIGVDPYYLTHKALKSGFKPHMILSGRKINDSIGNFVVEEVIRIMKNKNIEVINSKILIMGLSFKENCPDIRNTRVIDIVKGFESYNAIVDVFDPLVDQNDSIKEYGIDPSLEPVPKKYDAIVLAVAHDVFGSLSVDHIKSYGKENHALYDVKYILDAKDSDGRL